MRIVIVLFIAALLVGSMALIPTFADHRFEDRGKHVSSHSHEDEGNETTGQLAAWLFVGANLPVAGTLITRRFFLKKSSGGAHKRAARFYAWLKKNLMPFHYILNPVAIIMVLMHFKLSWCRSTSFTEWAVLLATILGVTGTVMKFRLAPPSFLRLIRAIHTHPVVMATVFGLAFLGHQLMD